jgi:hypothetical protein
VRVRVVGIFRLVWAYKRKEFVCASIRFLFSIQNIYKLALAALCTEGFRVNLMPKSVSALKPVQTSVEASL